MKYRGIFEYEYPTEHKPPISIDVHLHGDCVKGKIIEWEYRPQEQEPILDKIRAEIEKARETEIKEFNEENDIVEPTSYQRGLHEGYDEAIDDVLQIIDKYKAESEDKK